MFINMTWNDIIDMKCFLLIVQYTAELKIITSPWKVKLPSHMKGVSHNRYKSGTTDFGNLTSILFFADVVGKPLPVCKSELSNKLSHCLTCLSTQGAKWNTNKPVMTKLVIKNVPKRKAPHREIVQPLLRPNVVVCASIIARTSRDWVISCVHLKRKYVFIYSTLISHFLLMHYYIHNYIMWFFYINVLTRFLSVLAILTLIYFQFMLIVLFKHRIIKSKHS